MKPPFKTCGTISCVSGSTVTASLPRAAVGDICYISHRSRLPVPAQVVSFTEGRFYLAPFEDLDGVYPGARVESWGAGLAINVGEGIRGRVVSSLGTPMDDKGPIAGAVAKKHIYSKSPRPIERKPITDPFITGIRSIDAFCTLGRGQRIGIFASAGLGKSTLLTTIAQMADADVVVIALVGERGREVGEFAEELFHSHGADRCVLVVSTSDESSIARQTAPFTATAIAEHFAEGGNQVLLIVDSLTRTARAIRETSIAAGELPVRHGYTNSVYTSLPKLLERAGPRQCGSITGIYTVLTNEEDDLDPLADEVKSLIDGHLLLRRELAVRGVFPAIDITKSISRLSTRLQSDHHRTLATKLRSAFARLFRDKDTILLGGTPDPELARIVQHENELFDLIRQPQHGREEITGTISKLERIVSLLYESDQIEHSPPPQHYEVPKIARLASQLDTSRQRVSQEGPNLDL